MKRNHPIHRFGLVAATFVLASGLSTQAGIFRQWEDTEISDVKNRVATAKDRAVEIVDKARAGFNKVTGQMRDMIDEAVSDLSDELQDQLDGRNDFLGPGRDCGPGTECDGFRGDLVQLLTNMERLTNTMFEATPVDASTDYGPAIALVESAPGRALYPLYRVMNNENSIFGSRFVDLVGDLADDVKTLSDDLQLGDAARGGSRADVCQTILDHADGFESAITGVASVSGAVKLVGKALVAAGQTSIDEKDVGIHGYVHLTLKNNRKKKYGNALDGLADFGLALSSYASNKLRYCTVLQTRDDLLSEIGGVMSVLQGTDGSPDDMLDRILRNQSDIIDNQQEIMRRIDAVGPPWGQANGHAGRSAR